MYRPTCEEGPWPFVIGGLTAIGLGVFVFLLVASLVNGGSIV